MIKNILNILLLFLFLILETPAYPLDSSPKAIEKYTLKISRKFASTYCNSIRFGISEDSALKFSIGETYKEFSNSKLNKYIDYEFLNKNTLLSIQNKCQISDFPVYELEKLKFKY
tara:strand:+ start:300 stop:644 length:345 start_codon:yes stop_codon:yes gene_type:complete